MSSDQSHLAFAVVSWLQQTSSSLSADKQAKVKDAADKLADAFGVNTSDETQKQQYGQGPGLQSIFQVFLKTQKKMGGAGVASSSSEGSASAAADVPSSSSSSTNVPSADDLAKAEQLKTNGNKAMSTKDYGAAIEAYGQAIELNPKSAVYYSNRAAAFSQIGQHEEAIEDANKAAEIDSKFGKAYSRLGHALFSLARYSEAVEAYQKGIDVDPSNEVLKRGLAASQEQVATSSSSSDQTSRDAVSTNTSSTANADAGAGAGGFPNFGAGGMPDLGSLMNNPMVAQMAQSLMQNPQGLSQLMNNPMLRQAAERFGSDGGMPDMGSLMQDPSLRDLARNMMGGGGAGGQGGAGNNMFS